ncbi:OsmC family protein [Natronospira bacteriovora]|uniref:OsmC family protein n=1 Tax=Natronospira bacteriovora TaxID=3069753 RepID=A0ABU0W5D5_9GAMM|nr:OsmC family protein [Natronospira sp. AB-CW4]MDQ2068665.1 OsmC family protein [Natronospira sp. AB-CW4]
MQGMPHLYKASANGGPNGIIIAKSPGLKDLETDSPAQFGGSGDFWSPETLLVASISNCFLLTFRAVSRKSNLGWTDLWVDTEGTLDKTEDGLQFTRFVISARLRADDGEEEDIAVLLEKAKQHCLISNSLKAKCELRIEIEV